MTGFCRLAHLLVQINLHHKFSQHGLTQPILGESGFGIDLASISYIGREESITGHGSSPPCKKRLNYAVKPFFYFPKSSEKQEIISMIFYNSQLLQKKIEIF